MKKQLSKFIITFLIFIGFNTQLKAQINLSDIKGTIVLNNGDQLTGFVKGKTLSKMNLGVMFKLPTEKNFITYSINDFEKLQLENGENYQVLEVSILEDSAKRKVLGALLLKGEISVYAASYNEKGIYILVKNGKTYWLQDDELISNKMTVTKHFFKNTLFLILQDGGINENELIRIEFNEEDILNMVKRYNKAKNSPSESFKYKTPYQSFMITSINGNFFNRDDYEGMANIFYRFYSPRISKSTSLNIGIQYSYRRQTRLRYNGSGNQEYHPTISSISIPFLIQQNVLNKKIRPFLRGGLTLVYSNIDTNSPRDKISKGFQKSYGIGVLYGVGLEIDLLKLLMLKGDFYRDAVDHLMTVGIAYNLRLN